MIDAEEYKTRGAEIFARLQALRAGAAADAMQRSRLKPVLHVNYIKNHPIENDIHYRECVCSVLIGFELC